MESEIGGIHKVWVSGKLHGGMKTKITKQERRKGRAPSADKEGERGQEGKKERNERQEEQRREVAKPGNLSTKKGGCQLTTEITPPKDARADREPSGQQGGQTLRFPDMI